MTNRAEERRAFLSRAGRPGSFPVARVLPADCLTPVLLFRRMRASGAESFLLESVEGGEAVARYTFLGVEPSARLSVRDGATTLERDGRTIPCPGSPLATLEDLVRRADFVPDPDLPPLSSGAVGYLSYDAVRLFESIPDRHPRQDGLPDALFLLFDAVAAFDHPRQRLVLLTTVGVEGPGDAGAAVDRAIARLDRLESFVSAPDPPAAETSPSACPAKDWPRMTVNTPVTAETMATTAPIVAAVWTCALVKNPGSNTAVDSWCMPVSLPRPPGPRRLLRARWLLPRPLPRLRRGRRRPGCGRARAAHPHGARTAWSGPRA